MCILSSGFLGIFSTLKLVSDGRLLRIKSFKYQFNQIVDDDDDDEDTNDDDDAVYLA